MEDKVLNLLGLANAAGKLVLGEDTILKNIRNNQAKLVIVATDASDNTKKLYRNKCDFYKVRYVEYNDTATLSHAIGKTNRVAIGVVDKGFAKGLLTKLME